MTFGACAKHPNFPMINCPMCESEKPLTMYNKEALRKELEDKYSEWCKDTKRNGGVLIGKSIHEFFEWFASTTRLAALDGDQKKGQCNDQAIYYKEDEVDDGQEGKGLEGTLNENKPMEEGHQTVKCYTSEELEKSFLRSACEGYQDAKFNGKKHENVYALINPIQSKEWFKWLEEKNVIK